MRFFRPILNTVGVVGGFIILCVIGNYFSISFDHHRPLYFALWIAIPCFAFWLNRTEVVRLSYRMHRHLRTAFISVSCLIAFLTFASINEMRDRVGQRFVSGYQATYYDDEDEYGRPTTGVSVRTAHVSSRIALTAFECALLASCIVIPIVTWKASSRFEESGTVARGQS